MHGDTFVWLALAAAFLLSLPFAVYALCVERMVLPLRNIAAGLMLALLAAWLVRLMLSLPCPFGASWHDANIRVHLIFAVALVTQVIRLGAFRWLMKDAGHPGTAVSLGLGYGCLICFSGAFLFGRWAYYVSHLDTLSSGIPVSVLPGVHHVIGAVTGLGLQLVLTLLVARALQRKHAGWFVAAVLLDFAYAGLYELPRWGMLSEDVLHAGILVAGVAIFAYLIRNLPRKPSAA
jgi:hypothetical protein